MPGTVPGIENENTEMCGPCLQRDYNTVQADEYNKSVIKFWDSMAKVGDTMVAKEQLIGSSWSRENVISRSQSLTRGLETS